MIVLIWEPFKLTQGRECLTPVVTFSCRLVVLPQRLMIIRLRRKHPRAVNPPRRRRNESPGRLTNPVKVCPVVSVFCLIVRLVLTEHRLDKTQVPQEAAIIGRPPIFAEPHQRWLLEQAQLRNWDPTSSNKGVSRQFYRNVISDWVELHGFSLYTEMPEDKVKNTLGKNLSSLSPDAKVLTLRNRDEAKKILREVCLFCPPHRLLIDPPHL
jgi:hypothetical protein